MAARKKILGALVLSGGLLSAGGLQAQQAGSSLPVVELVAGMYRIQAELAHTPASRQRGLMGRERLGAGEGMIFVFDHDARHCMWMKNTPLPLSVAFVDAGGEILNIEDMQPHTEDSHCARAPARFALEMTQGWFRARGITAGTRLRGVGALPHGR